MKTKTVKKILVKRYVKDILVKSFNDEDHEVIRVEDGTFHIECVSDGGAGVDLVFAGSFKHFYISVEDVVTQA